MKLLLRSIRRNNSCSSFQLTFPFYNGHLYLYFLLHICLIESIHINDNNNNNYIYPHNQIKAKSIINNYFAKKQQNQQAKNSSSVLLPLINVTAKPVSVWLPFGGANCSNAANGNCNSMYPNVSGIYVAPEYACSMPNGPGTAKYNIINNSLIVPIISNLEQMIIYLPSFH